MNRSIWLVAALAMTAGCEPGEADEDILKATNDSVKELVACGGMQFAAMRGLAGSVVTEAGYPEVAEMLFGQTDLVREDEAYVTLLQGGTFVMRFSRVGDPRPLELDVFSFDSYVADPVLDTPESIDTWQAGDTQFALHFSGPGPLFDMLDAGRGLQSPIEFEIIPDDVYALAWSNQLQGDLREVFGPLFDELCIDSELDFEETRDGVHVGYRMTTPPATILGLLDDGTLNMQIEYLEARSTWRTVRPIDVDVRYTEQGRRGLAGAIRYQVFDSDGEDEVCTATADYGDGAVYGDLSDNCGWP